MKQKNKKLLGQRLNQYISHNTSFSRREADELIKAGRVKIGTRVVLDLSTRVEEGMKIFIDGKPVREKKIFTVIVYNKPKGELVTKRDERGRRTIYESLPAQYKHFIPVGRLDFASEGLLLLTDSPKVAHALMTSNLERIYRVKIKGPVTPKMEKAMMEGLDLKDATKGAHEKSEISSMVFAPFFAYQIIKNTPLYSILKIAIGEGQNREIRRFFAHFDADVVDLKRLGFGGIELSALPTGKTRYLTKKEYENLRKFLKEESISEENNR